MFVSVIEQGIEGDRCGICTMLMRFGLVTSLLASLVCWVRASVAATVCPIVSADETRETAKSKIGKIVRWKSILAGYGKIWWE